MKSFKSTYIRTNMYARDEMMYIAYHKTVQYKNYTAFMIHSYYMKETKRRGLSNINSW